MRRFSVVLIILLSLLVSVGIIAGQSDTPPEPAFELVQAIGLPLPRSVLYEPNYERYAIVDAYGALMFVDAHTYETQHILYNSGDYTDFAFSRSGRWFALTIGTRIELWDAENFTIVSELTDLSQALSVHGPLTFSPDDNLLLFYGTHPEAQSLRRTEFDTQTIPWIWNLTAARNEGDSTFPGEVEVYPFFDYRNGFVLGPENRIVAALPGRLHVIDAYSLEILFEIETLRYEQDPLSVLFSARDNNIYVRPLDAYSLLQVDTQRGLLVEIPLGTALTRADIDLLGGIELGTSAQLIGEAADTGFNPLISLFIGEGYRNPSAYGSDPLTITLIDLVVPPTGDGDRVQALLFLFDERLEMGYFFTYRPRGTQQIALSPDGEDLLFRRSDETVEIYEIATGERTFRATPGLRGVSFFTWQDKNRVLSYNIDGTEFVSDFERFNVESGDSLQQDLRYSRRVERFFWSQDSRSLVTLSGNEWRLFDIETGEVLRREALPLRGGIIATSADGYRYLTDTGGGRAVYDIDTDETRSVNFVELPARPISNIIASPDWEHYLVIYSANSWGSYYPGNEVAMYSLDDGLLWFIAGDDLPYPENRQYGWVDNETIYITGEVFGVDQPHRVYGLEFAETGVPQCLAETAANAAETAEQALAWEALTRGMTSDELGSLTNLICGQVEQGIVGLDLLQPTATSPYVTATPVLIAGVPPCLTIENPTRADEMAQIWNDITDGMTAAQIAEAELLVCEGIGPTATPRPDFTPQAPPPVSSAPEQAIETMFIDVESGEGATTSYAAPPYVNPMPMEPLAEAFRRTMGREPGLIALSPDRQLMAASNLPGELLIYRPLVSYDALLAQLTATAVSRLATAQLIALLPSPTAPYNVVGTARPTMTPTVTPTSPPRPDEETDLPQDGETEQLCPVETLYTAENLPDGFDPTGRIITTFGTEDYLWVVEPETGQRYRDEEIPLCSTQLNCQFSWDGRWILVTDFDEIYIVRPDGSDHRTLFESDDIWPDSIYWWGNDLLIYEQPVPVEGQPNTFETYIIRNYIDREDDPERWLPFVEINGERAEIISTAYGEGYVVVRTTFSTGLGPGYRYYTHNMDTGETVYFSRLGDYPPEELSFSWVRDVFGVRLFYQYPERIGRLYVFDPHDATHREVGETRYSGTLAPNLRYRAFSTSSRSQPIGVWDTQTGLLRTYCVPETGARTYDGGFTWSPDSRYIALQTYLPRDESEEGVGQHTLVLDTETGAVVDLTTGVNSLVTWAEDPEG